MICSNLHNLAKTWQEKFEDSQRALETFQRTFSDSDRVALTQALESTRQAQEAYETASKTLVEFKGKQVIAREAVLLEWMGGLVGSVRIDVSERGDVKSLNVSNNRSAESDINNAMKFVKVFQGLTKLYCFNNPNLSSLPDLPQGLRVLSCSKTNLSSLPKLPQGLTTLDCFNTQITVLPELPQGLTVLECFNTNLTVLPELPQGLTKLFCHNNQNLSSLPELPQGLKVLNCSNTNIISLPDPLPNTLTRIDIRNTTAANDVKVTAILDAFKASYPSADVRY